VEAEDEDNDEDDGQPQQEVNGVAAELTAERVSDTHLFSKEDGSPRPAERQRLLSSYDLSPEPSHNKAGSDSNSNSDDKLDKKADSDKDNGKPRPTKQKRPSSSDDGLTPKKSKHHQQRSARKRRPHSKSYRPCPKSHSPLDQGSRVAVVPNLGGRLPSPAPSTPQVMDIEMSSDYCNLGVSSRDILLTLVKVTFCLYSPHCYSFIAVI